MHLFWRVIVWLNVCLMAGLVQAEPARPRSILILDQSDISGPLFHQIFSGLLATLNASPDAPVTIYFESLDLSRFKGADYEQSLHQHLQTKYRDKAIGVVVPVGAASLELVLRFRKDLWPDVPVIFAQVDEATVAKLKPPPDVTWPDVPVIFAQVDEATVAKLKPPPDVTGVITELRLRDMITTARALVPDLKGVAFVGDAWETQTVYRHWKDEVPTATVGLEVIDLTGRTMRELRTRVANLPDHTAILYTAIYSDGEGTFYPPVRALDFLAEVANRPIVISVETYIGRGGIGGFVLVPSLIGESAARLALRIINGESPASLPISSAGLVKPVFDWKQMQRWGVSESNLPPGSEIRFHEPSVWRQYRLQFLATALALLFQAALITWLSYEHRRRHLAEVKSRQAMAELTYMNRVAGAGELSASIAHEVNQPLTGMVLRANAALRWLAEETPGISEAKTALAQIVEAGHRASAIVINVRLMFKKDTQERVPVDINALIRSVLPLVYIDLHKHGIETQISLAEDVPLVTGNAVQLQQVILNLVMNAIESMSSAESRLLSIRSRLTGKSSVLVSIEDTGSGIDPSNIDRIFRPLFTTKSRGMGMGLSICRSIIESHDGKIWASPGAAKGSVFQFEIPTVKRRSTGTPDRRPKEALTDI